MKKLRTTIFTWGYWGWGTSTDRLIDVFDQVEAARGFAPSLFAEIRFIRGGRAPGFRGDTFERAIGKDRYRWMKDLGNKAVEARSGPRVQIARPQAADDLLGIAVAASERRQRVVFFCACESPARCHRATVAKLVSDAAKRRGTPVEIVEWPGGEPLRLELEIPHDVLAKVNRGGKTVALPGSADLAQLAGLPWYSNVILRSGSEEADTLCSPAVYSTKLGWHLKILARGAGQIDQTLRRKRMHEFRQEGGYEAVA